MHRKKRDDLFGVERWYARDHFEKHDRQRIEVGACVHGLAEGLLRGDVGRRPNRDAELGETGTSRLDMRIVEQLRDPEV